MEELFDDAAKHELMLPATDHEKTLIAEGDRAIFRNELLKDINEPFSITVILKKEESLLNLTAALHPAAIPPIIIALNISHTTFLFVFLQ